ncbi:MAG: LamG domain-containing protein [bacterium]|jgi:hypothetical protein
MKRTHLFPVLIIFMTGTILFFSCQKQETEMLTSEDNFASDLKTTDGYALYFDGDWDWVEVPDDPSLDLTEQFSIAAWINIEEYVEWASIVTKGGWAQDPEGNWYEANNYAIHQSGDMLDPNEFPNVNDFGYMRFTGDNPEWFPFPESETKMSLNTWYFVALTWDGEYLKFYLNGELDGVHELGGTFAPNDIPLFIGVDFPGGIEFWKGMIDEVRIWNEALKQTHIQASMNGHAAPLARALVGYWRFDEGEGEVAHDRSTHENHGMLMGDVTWVSPGAPIGN